VTDVEVKSNVALLRAGAARVAITAESEHVIRVHAAASGTFRSDVSWAVVPHQGARPEWQVRDAPSGLVLALSDLRVRIDKSPLRIALLDADDRVLDEDAAPMSLGSGGGFHVQKRLPPDEHIYGLGDKAGPFDRRGRSFVNWNIEA